MRAYKLIQCVILFFIISCLFACGSIDTIVQKKGIYDGVLLNKQGGLTVIEAKSRTRVPACDNQEDTQHHKSVNYKCKRGFDKRELTKLKDFYNTFKELDPKAELIDIIIIKEFEGSWCRTYYSSATFQEFQVCRPPY